MKTQAGIRAAAQATPLAYALEEFILDTRARHLAPATIKFYTAKLRPFVAYCQDAGVATIETLTADTIKRYLLAMTARGCNTQTVHLNARAIRAFLNFCKRDELLADNPFDRVKLPKVDHDIKDALTEPEILTLLKACQRNARDYALFLFLLDTGVRASELLAISVGDLNQPEFSVLLRHTKARRQRTCYLAPKTLKALRKYLSHRPDVRAKDPLFPGQRGRLTSAGLVQIFDRLSHKTGIHVTAHVLRRTCAISMLRNGASLYHVQRQLGHAGLDVLKFYLPLVEDDLRDAHAKFSPVDNL